MTLEGDNVMRNKYILLLCAVVLLPGCVALADWLDSDMPDQPSGTSIGRTYAQLVVAKRADEVIHYGDNYYCHSCDGQPTRTYTNLLGNKVAVYFYSAGYDYPISCARHQGCSGDYSRCEMIEDRYELKDGVVVDEWKIFASGDEYPLYTRNTCAGYNHINNSAHPTNKEGRKEVPQR
jgi:hypothetical protein